MHFHERLTELNEELDGLNRKVRDLEKRIVKNIQELLD